MLDVAISKGDLNSADDLDMYCASAASVCNLEHTHNGHTVLEYLTGEIPHTHRDLVTQTEIPEILHGLDSDFLDQLKHLLHEQNALVQIGRDDDARYTTPSSVMPMWAANALPSSLSNPVTKCHMKGRSTPYWSSYSPLPPSPLLRTSDQSHQMTPAPKQYVTTHSGLWHPLGCHACTLQLMFLVSPLDVSISFTYLILMKPKLA